MHVGSQQSLIYWTAPLCWPTVQGRNGTQQMLDVGNLLSGGPLRGGLQISQPRNTDFRLQKALIDLESVRALPHMGT